MPTTKNFTQTTEKKNLFEEIKSHKKEIIVTSVLLGEYFIAFSKIFVKTSSVHFGSANTL